MKKTNEKQIDMSMSASNPSAVDLRGRQSVRATFRLSEDCVNAPRDALVEYSVRRLLPIIAKERKKHDQRKNC